MKIGIIGTGNIGGTLAKLWADAGHQVMVSSRHPEQLTGLVEDIGENASVGTVEEAVRFGEVVFLAMPLKGVLDTLPKIKDDLSGTVVLDAMNPFPNRDGEVATEIQQRGIASGVATQERLPDSKVVRAFSSVYYQALQTEHHLQDHWVAVPIAGNDDEAKTMAANLVRDAGFEPFDLGSLSDSRPLDPGGSLFTETLTSAEMQRKLGTD
ncbi:MAG TPA: NAD(P)-binding domain-containing protein [bacterium]|nr:NAD(P)-binding domain-containing protein [bacterium]